MYEIIVLYTLNLYNVICQLYLNKTGGGRKNGREFSKCDKKYKLTDTGSSQTLRTRSRKKTTLRYIIIKVLKNQYGKNCKHSQRKKKTHYV